MQHREGDRGYTARGFNFSVSMWGNLAHLDKGDFTVTDIAAGVPNGDFPIVLDPALTTQNVMNTRCHFVPLIVVSKAVNESRDHT